MVDCANAANPVGDLKTLVLLVLTALLAAAVIWAHLNWGLSLEAAAAMAGLLAVAAAVVALYPFRRRGRCYVTDPYLTITRPADSDFIRVHVEARALNGGAEARVLQRVDFLFYRLDGAWGRLWLFFGARELEKANGHILPVTLVPEQPYMIGASDHFDAESELGRFVLAGTYENFVLRCRFVFDGSAPRTIRLQPHSAQRPRVLSSLLVEWRIGISRAEPATHALARP
jgi:hypothetical protein